MWAAHRGAANDTARMRHCTEWIEFDAHSDVQPLLNSLGQLDRYAAIRDGNAIEGVTLRLFNPATGEWSLHWTDTVNPGVLLPPMVGRFTGDVGEFFGDELVDTRRVLCRFDWTRTNPGFSALGTGVLGRWGKNMGDELDHDIYSTGWITPA